jgi:hypothetical protein
MDDIPRTEDTFPGNSSALKFGLQKKSSLFLFATSAEVL